MGLPLFPDAGGALNNKQTTTGGKALTPKKKNLVSE